jgi:AraC-like DNA-binding protein
MKMDQQLITRLTGIILENLRNEDFGVKELARLSGISRSVLNHRLYSILNKNINQFIREVRLQKAFELLQNEEITASEVAYKVGFSSPAYFNNCFHEYFGFPPGKVEKKDSVSPKTNNLTSYFPEPHEKLTVRLPINIRINSILIIAILILVIAILIYLKIVN